MNVNELIEKLRSLPGNAEVIVGAETGPGMMAPARRVTHRYGARVIITGDDPAAPASDETATR